MVDFKYILPVDDNMPNNLTGLYSLIHSNSSLANMQALLRDKGLPFSGTWNDIFSKRIPTALEEKTLLEADLFEFLQDSEEHGAQHIFLFSTSASNLATLLSEEHLQNQLKGTQNADLLERPRTLVLPETPTLVDARYRQGEASGPFIVIKSYETRETYEQVSVTEKDGRRLTEERLVRVRFSNVAKLHSSGILEIRIASRSNTNQYHADLVRFRSLINSIIDTNRFFECSLAEFKRKLAEGDQEAAEKIRSSQNRFKNRLGNIVTTSTGDVAKNLADDSGIKAGLAAFVNHEDGTYCEQSNFFVKMREGQTVPSKDTNVVLSEKSNEFIIRGKCSRVDYEYVLSTILEYNSPIPQ